MFFTAEAQRTQRNESKNGLFLIPSALFGKPVIIHAKEDDLKSQPSGAAGDRIGGGVIEMAK